jgi:glycosyltransferase involved in cell wall biosynthesis
LTGTSSAGPHVVQVSVFVDPLSRAPEQMLEAWPALHFTAHAAALAGCRVEVVQAAAADAERTRDEVSYHFVAERLPSRLRRRMGRAWAPLTPRVFDEVVALAPDVVHFHGLSFPRHVGRLTRLLNDVPLLAQDHADRPRPSWRRGVQRRGLAQLAGVVFTARAQADPWVAAGIFAPTLPVLEVIESTSSFTPGKAFDQGDVERGVAEARRASGVDGDPCFLWVGHLDDNKDPLTVLDAFAKVIARLPDARLWMCYRGAPLLAQVRARIASDAGLAERVTLLGSRSHAAVEDLLRAADFLVLGSHREGSGYSVLEALASGATPLVTDIPSLRRITGDGAVGALFPPGDAAALAGAMIDWAGRDRAAIRRNAREHFERRLSLEALGRELRTAYDTILGQRR